MKSGRSKIISAEINFIHKLHLTRRNEDRREEINDVISNCRSNFYSIGEFNCCYTNTCKEWRKIDYGKQLPNYKSRVRRNVGLPFWVPERIQLPIP